ncbi:uncharacterized protein LOC587517 [Strongylocentrotus purpuratus]|uniref:Uncharacterized protein n=1 Tax=Strongylocentrotus purpuratus TaxID=7668 RepID=A0A7M7NVS9_STRPU|nr:uncharacterized protein LOC587517 [Strongylocentrotus purpuratus]
MSAIMSLKRIKWTKSKILFGLVAISFISLAAVIFMVDLTSNIIVRPGHGKKSALSLFTDGNYSGLRGKLGQISSYQSNSSNIRKASPTFTCSQPPVIRNTSAARLRTDVSYITLDELCWQTFGDNMSTIGRLSRLSNKILEEVNKTAILEERNQTVDEVFHELGLMIDVDGYIYLPGGHWKPMGCSPKWKVAVVVPFRDRIGHLAIFLRHMIPLLKTQQLEFSIFVVEQNNNMSFNRAMLLNVGFLEALKLTRYDCFVFHDVDHLALNVNNYYGCDFMPRHFISGDDIWGYTILYPDLFGGVTGLTKSQMHSVNGFSNMYWGWGGEDDDMYRRIQQKGYPRSRPVGSFGFYNTINHHGEKKVMNKQRICLLHFSMERMKSDGLKSINYEEPNIDLTPLFTKISVDIHELPWKDEWTKCAGPLMDAFRTEDDEPIDSESARVPHPLKAAVARRKQPYPHSPVAQANKIQPNEPLDEMEIERREAVIRRRQEIEKERKENKRTGTAPHLEMEVL